MQSYAWLLLCHHCAAFSVSSMVVSSGRFAQVAWKGGNPWHSRPAVDAQATCSTGSGKLFEQPVHAVHAFSAAWPPPPPPAQVCRSISKLTMLSCCVGLSCRHYPVQGLQCSA